MYNKYVPNMFADKSNQISLNNSYDGFKKDRPALAGGKKRGVKTVLNVKANKTHEDWYFACEDYQALESQDIKMKRSSLLNYSNCANCFTGTNNEEQ